jgi:hypothetical protein
MLAQLNWLRQTLAQLLHQAGKQANPRLYAEVVLDNLPPFVTEKDLLERLAADNWWSQLQQVDGRVTAHAEWFQKFRDRAVRLLRHKARAAEAAPAEEPQPMAEGEGGEFE